MITPELIVQKCLHSSWAEVCQLMERLDQHNPGSWLHARGVSRCTYRIARRMGFPEIWSDWCCAAGFLHDIGKLKVPAELLNKPGPLLKLDDVAIVQAHTTASREMLSDLPELAPVLDGLYLHHEHMDGSGYPLGLRGGQIPFVARMIAIADVYTAMTQSRPYREAICEKEVLNHMWLNTGTQLDPILMACFAAVVDEEQQVNNEEQNE